MNRKAVVLFSGGLDSTTVLAIALERSFDCHCLSFHYGQRHVVELTAAAILARQLGAVEHRILRLDGFSETSALTSSGTYVPKNRSSAEMSKGVPSTYVPARNTVFLAHALAWAETLGASDIFAGMNAVDYSGYPDCRPEYLSAFQAMARLGTQQKTMTIHAPLVRMTKKEIILEGMRLAVDYSKTHSCYDPDPDGCACRVCDSCQIRARGFAEAEIPDPTRYVQ